MASNAVTCPYCQQPADLVDSFFYDLFAFINALKDSLSSGSTQIQAADSLAHKELGQLSQDFDVDRFVYSRGCDQCRPSATE